MKNWKILLLLPLLAACGGNFYDSAKGTLSQADATTEKSTLMNAAKFSFSTPDESPGFTRSDLMRDPNYSACTTLTPASPVDTDSDGIPASKKAVYNCSGIVDADSTYFAKGEISATDADDNNPAGGFKFEYDLNGGFTNSVSTLKRDQTVEGFHEMTKAGAAYTYKSNFQNTTKYEKPSVYSVTYTSGSTYEHSMTANDATAPLGGGTVTLSGYYGVKKEVSGTDPDNNEPKDYVLKISSEGLKYQATGCTNFYKEGWYQFEDGSGNKIRVTFVDCSTAPVVKYNDTTI